MRKRLQILYENKDKYKTMSKQAINSAKQFSIEYYGKKILEVYDRAISNYKLSIVDKIKNKLKR